MEVSCSVHVCIGSLWVLLAASVCGPVFTWSIQVVFTIILVVGPHPGGGFENADRISQGHGNRMWSLFQLGLLTPLTLRMLAEVRVHSGSSMHYLSRYVLWAFSRARTVLAPHRHKR